MTDQPLAHLGPDVTELGISRATKIRLPLRTHIRLRAEKLLHGAPISAIIHQALTEYFARHPTESPTPEQTDARE